MFLTKSKPQPFKVIYEARDALGKYTGSSCTEKLTWMRSHCSYTFLVMLFADNLLTILKLSKEYGCSSLALSTVYHWFCSVALKTRQKKHDRSHGEERKRRAFRTKPNQSTFQETAKATKWRLIFAHHIIYRSLKETICHCQTTLSSQW